MKSCSPLEVALKSYFLGPQAENTQFLQIAILNVLRNYTTWRKNLFPQDGAAISDEDHLTTEFLDNQGHMQKLLRALSGRFQNEVPQFSPRYFGHMFSELNLPGLLGHFVALLHNPNNISQESSKVGLKIEEEALQALYRMLGWKKAKGHLTSGGTVANLEALLRMRAKIPERKWPQAKLISSAAAHYSWKKNLKIMGFPDSAFVEIPLDSEGRMSIPHLQETLRHLKSPLLGVVSLFGSTERGAVDEIDKINRVLHAHKKSRIWHHVDAAYGGFFAATKPAYGSHLAKQIRALRKIDSLTLDPHKLGYIPYGCGTILCRHAKDYYYAKVNAPYIQFKSSQEIGVQSVEGSRPATGATATWLTARTLGFHSKGLGRVLSRHLKVKEQFQKKMERALPNVFFTKGLDLNILCWNVQPKSKKLSEANQQVKTLFEQIPTQSHPYFVSKTTLPLKKNPWLRAQLKERDYILDANECTLIRMTLMNPFLMTKETRVSFIDDFLKTLQPLLSVRRNKKKSTVGGHHRPEWRTRSRSKRPNRSGSSSTCASTSYPLGPNISPSSERF